MNIYENGKLIEVDLNDLQQKLLEESLNDSTVHACLHMWRKGYCTYEEAISQALFYLMKQNKEMTDRVVEYTMRYGKL
jgi:hypothetical protein